MTDTSPNPRDDLMHTLFVRPLEQPWNSGADAWRTGHYWLRQPSTCHARLRHGDKLCVERDNPLPRLGPAFTTTVVCTVCAPSTPIPSFQATRSMESDNDAHSGPTVLTMSTRGWKLSKQRCLDRKTHVTTRCHQIRSCNRFWRVYPPAYASRFRVVSLTHWETLRYKVIMSSTAQHFVCTNESSIRESEQSVFIVSLELPSSNIRNPFTIGSPIKSSISCSLWTKVQWECVHCSSCVQVHFRPCKPLRTTGGTNIQISKRK